MIDESSRAIQKGQPTAQSEATLARKDMVYFLMREFIIYDSGDGEWTAECMEIPGYRGKGATKEEAIEKVKAALLIYHPCKCEDND